VFLFLSLLDIVLFLIVLIVFIFLTALLPCFHYLIPFCTGIPVTACKPWCSIVSVYFSFSLIIN